MICLLPDNGDMCRALAARPMKPAQHPAQECCGLSASPLQALSCSATCTAAVSELVGPPLCRSRRPVHLVLTSTPCLKSCSGSCPQGRPRTWGPSCCPLPLRQGAAAGLAAVPLAALGQPQPGLGLSPARDQQLSNSITCSRLPRPFQPPPVRRLPSRRQGCSPSRGAPLRDQKGCQAQLLQHRSSQVLCSLNRCQLPGRHQCGRCRAATSS